MAPLAFMPLWIARSPILRWVRGSITLVACLLAMVAPLAAQQASAQQRGSTEPVFTQEIDALDEFVERFNSADRLFLKQYGAKARKNPHETRTFLIKSLFNLSGKQWNVGEISQFLITVNDSTRPVYLNFADNNWYAELILSVEYMGKPEKVALILRYEEGREFSRWAIKTVKAKWLSEAVVPGPPLPNIMDSTKGINPASHGNDFIALYRCLDDLPNLRSYAVRDTALPAELDKFFRLIQTKKITISQIDRVTYHFMQVRGWIFTVRNYPYKPKTNSGWLISQLFRADGQVKEQYKRKILNLN